MNTDFRGLWLLAGAWLSAVFAPPWWAVVALLLIFAVLFTLLLRARHDAPYAAPWFTGPLLMLLAALAVVGGSLGHTPCDLPQGEQQRRVELRFEDSPRTLPDGRVAGAAQITGFGLPDRWVSCQIPVYLSLKDPPPAHADTFRTIASLQPALESGTFNWWARADSELLITGWHTPTAADHLKARFTQQLGGTPELARALLPGMLYGDRSGQEQQLRDAMVGSGLSHLTAVSGSNIALIGAVLLVLLRLVGAPRVLASALMIAGLGLFVWFAGPDPSVLRAGLMGAVAVISLLTGRGRGSLMILGVCATVLLLLDHTLGTSPAFTLSVLATAGIIVLAPLIATALSRMMPAALAELSAICLAAQVACLPVVIALNSNFSLYSLPANVLVAPLLPLITTLGMLALLVCTPFPWLAHGLSWLIGWPAEAVGQLAQFTVGLPGAARPWPPGAAGIALAAGLTLSFTVLVLVGHETEKVRIRQLALILLGAVVVFTAATVLPVTLFIRPPVESQWSIAMCDVGQGDALVIRTGPEQGWLIDAGPPEGNVVSCLHQLGITQLPKVFITHAHNDHFGGVQALEDSGIQIGQRLVSSGFPSEQWAAARVLTPGDSDQIPGLRYRVLGPDPRLAKYAEPNDTSLVLRFSFDVQGQNIDFFSAGDMEEESMRRLLATAPQAPALILKASHHGARNGGVELIEALHPAVLLVSVGADNTYGHPNAQIVERAQELGAKVLRTDELGTVLLTLEPDGAHAAALDAPIR